MLNFIMVTKSPFCSISFPKVYLFNHPVFYALFYASAQYLLVP